MDSRLNALFRPTRIAMPVRIAAVSGLVVTVLSVVFALVPIVHVASDLVFAAKIVGVAVIVWNFFRAGGQSYNPGVLWLGLGLIAAGFFGISFWR